MDSFRHQKSPRSDIFLGFFSRPETLTAANGSAGVELHEDEVFWNGADFSAPNPPSATANSNPSSMLSPSSSRSFRRLAENNFGILAALSEDDKKRALRNPSFLQHKPSIFSSSSTSTSPSPSSSARMVPAIPKPKLDYSQSVPVGKIHHHSAPLHIPVAPRRERSGSTEQEPDGDEEADEDEMLPPHEIVARRYGMESPMTTFSMLEGVGRTLKGRDLRRVRNAVWRQTGFLD